MKAGYIIAIIMLALMLIGSIMGAVNLFERIDYLSTLNNT